MVRDPLISVVMTVYNESEKWLKESLDSILNQSYSNIQLIVVYDNPANLKLLAVLNDYCMKHQNIDLFINSKNLGLVASLNKAIKHVKGSYIARMDADDISHKNRIEQQLLYLNKYNFDFIGCKGIYINETGDYLTDSKTICSSFFLKFYSLIGGCGIIHPTFFAKKEVFINLNGYNDIDYVEDKDFISRAIYNHYKIGNLRTKLLYIRKRQSGISLGNAYKQSIYAKYVTKLHWNRIFMRNDKYNISYRKKIIINDKSIANYDKASLLLITVQEDLAKYKYLSAFFNIIKSISISNSIALKLFKAFNLRFIVFVELILHRLKVVK